jgi:hypothetical protein
MPTSETVMKSSGSTHCGPGAARRSGYVWLTRVLEENPEIMFGEKDILKVTIATVVAEVLVEEGP